MKKIILNIIFVIYVIIAVFITVCLLSFNQFKVTEFGDYSLVLVTNEELQPEFKNGDLVIVNKNDESDIGEKIFFYNVYERDIQVTLANVTNIEPVTSTESTYTVEGEHKLSSEYVIGPADSAIVVGGAGTVLSLLESRWGFLFIIVLPALLAFIYQITVVVAEIRGSKEDEGKKPENEGK